MNTPTILTKFLRLIVTFLLIVGVHACSSSSPAKRASDQPQEKKIPVEIVETPVAAESESAEIKHAEVRVKTRHPRKYTVKKGDTLWDISSQFLTDPWYWPEIWHKNRQVQNPHLIYPGDVLTLIYVNGQPQIAVNETPKAIPRQAVPSQQKATYTAEPGRPSLRTVKLTPTIRKQGIDASVVTIPGDAIRQFLTKPRVVTEEELENAPYILGSDDNHLIMGQNNIVYIRGELDKDRVRFTVFRPGKELIDPETDDVLGYEAIYAGEAHIKQYGDPSIALLTSTEREVLIGDRLLSVDKSKADNLYYPRAPDLDVKGQIISLYDALFGIGEFQIAVINRGSRDGIEVGHLLETRATGDTIKDNYSMKDRGDYIKLPNKRSGLMMIFRIFDKVSYGLVLDSTLVISKHDVVATPR